jgi:hypothetical protein
VKKLLAILAIGGLLSVGCNAESSKGSPKVTAPAAPSRMAPSPSTGPAPAPSPPPGSDAGKGIEKKSGEKPATAKADKPGKQ